MSQSAKQTNRLIHATSPYLRQHAHNPVDWYSWGEEALRGAREQDKPILLSIGYSACHWCHVMERESFENEEVAHLMNEHFINIKVDREERPDLDAIYMNFVQMTTGSGGWPLTVFLTPDQLPFYGGTYFPPEDYYGRPGFKRVLQNIADVYRNRREEIENNRDEILRRLQQMALWELPAGRVEEKTLHDAASKLVRDFDARHGGFGGAPKFPAAMALGFLLRYHERTGSDPALRVVNVSLKKMARGGIYDQLGGGFHRYAVDELWLVPHFEKMLYDNALLSRVYLEAYQLTGNPYYREIVEETLEWVQREMTAPEGGFYSAYDADSEGEEGKFYVWTPAQVEAVLDSEEAEIFSQYYDVTPSGNFEGKNILHHRTNLESYAGTLDRSPQDLKELLDRARRKLFEERKKRVKPGLDDKVLAAWNGLMLISFADAGFMLESETLLATALRNAEFLATHMRPDGRLRRSWKDGKAALKGYLEDYALVIAGWISTYEATGEVRWLEEAGGLMEQQLELFWDSEKGDFYFTPKDHEELLVRQKEFMDNATPSGNSVSCLNLLRLAVLLGRRDYREIAERVLGQTAGGAAQYPSAFGYWLQAFDFFLGPVREIAVVGDPPERAALLEPIRRRFIPNKVVAVADEGDSDVAAKVPLLENKSRIEGQAALYVCENYTCRQPVTTAEDVEKLL